MTRLEFSFWDTEIKTVEEWKNKVIEKLIPISNK